MAGRLAAFSKLRLPAIGAPLFIVSNPALVIAQVSVVLAAAAFSSPRHRHRRI